MLLRNALLRMAGLCTALVMLAGCSTLSQKLVSPELSLLGIQMLSTDMFAQKFKVRVLVKNANDLEVPIRGIEYTIILMGDSFAEGVSKDQFLLPARGEAEFQTDFVAITEDGAAWLVERGVQLVGVDYLSGQRRKQQFGSGLCRFRRNSRQ